MTVDMVYSEVEVRPPNHRPIRLSATKTGKRRMMSADRFPIRARCRMIPIVSLKSTVLKMSDSLAADVIARHAGSGEDQWGFLPCLRG